MIRLRDIHYAYPSGSVVFEGLDFSFDEGGKVGLVGPNGAGKTTLFHIIMGLIAPDSGTVEVLGTRRVTEHDFREVRREIGLLFQDADDQLFCPTVAEDVAFGPLNLGRSHEDAERIALDTLESLGLSGYASRVTYQLSGGEKRLVSLATVLAMEPRALLLDEPTSGLDEKTTARLVEILNGLDRSYIIISHDHDFLARTTEGTMRLQHGAISG